MLVFAFWFLAWARTSHVLAGQIPVVGGLLGGVPNAAPPKTSTRAAIFANSTTPGKLRIVENSGICETTPGVYQASGYADLTSTESLWFWFFAARKNPDTAPLALWFNGGPGASSMIGLFQEHGPCRITNDSSSVTLNPYSWNNEANVIYIDQPVGAGFSYGDLKVGTSAQAAADVWTFMQIFLSDSRFSKYKSNTLAIWTESYGGHYGPAFATNFLAQNDAIAAKKLTGIPLNLKVVGIGDGLVDPLTQYAGYITYAANNPYHPLVNSTVISEANSSWTSPNGCQAQIKACNFDIDNVNETICSNAQGTCNNDILGPLGGNYDVYYVLTQNPDPYPPDISRYLASISTQVGAEVPWQETNADVYTNFAMTGDWMRSSLSDVEFLLTTGIRTVIYEGDADYILNFNGVEAMIDALDTKYTTLYQQQSFQTYTVAGQTAGQYKNAGPFSYIRIYGAGHEVAAYKFGNLSYGQAAAQIFTQIMANQSLSSTSASLSTSGAFQSKPVCLLLAFFLLPTLSII